MLRSMSSHTRERERGETRRLSIRTLVIAFVAASVAGVVTSQFWIPGTWISTGLTPVLVALISELLHRPTEAVSRRLTSERTAPLPEAAGPAAPPPEDADPLPQRVPAEPGSRDREAPAPPVQVYRRGRGPSRRRIAIGVVALTAVLAFAAAALAITSADLITGGSVGHGNRKTTLFGGHHGARTEQQPTATTPTQTAPQQTNTTTTQKKPTPKPQQTTPTQSTPT